MPTEGDDDRLLLARQHRRSWLPRSCPDVRNRATALPLANSLLVDAVALCERSQALLTMLYRSTDRLRRRGASMKNLAHSASFHSTEKIAPSKAGIKHLAFTANYRKINGATGLAPLKIGTVVLPADRLIATLL